MTRFEKWKQKDVKDVATELCLDISDRIEDCDRCPFTDWCARWHNGVLDYLMEEVEQK